jgi:hypothetical protein
MVAAVRSFFIFFRTFPHFFAPRAILPGDGELEEPRGLRWAGRCGQSVVVSWGRLYINATHIVKRKNGLGAGAFRASGRKWLDMRQQTNAPAGLLPSIQENVLSPVSPAHDVVHRSGILDAHLAGHGATLPKTPASRQDRSK